MCEEGKFMQQTCWDIWPDRGFLVNPDPLRHLSAVDTPLQRSTVDMIEGIAAQIPALMENGQIRATLENLPVFDLPTSDLLVGDFRIVERLMMLYSFFASAYVYFTPETPEHRIPSGVAVPLHRLSKMVERPPILSYSGYVLNNWKRNDAAGEIALGNIALLQNFLGGKDEDWFILVHVDIEARAAGALAGIQSAQAAAAQDDAAALQTALQNVSTSVQAMITSFDRMPENCDPNVYYYRVRPYIFGFNDVVYEGVAEYGNKPQSFRGQTGAQSSIVPSLVSALGLQHEQSGLTQHLDIMRDYMPKPHREFAAHVKSPAIRQSVLAHSSDSALRNVYNECLTRVLEFRRLHLHYATTYIFQKVTNPIGTGGTVFMDWLAQLANETEAQLV